MTVSQGTLLSLSDNNNNNNNDEADFVATCRRLWSSLGTKTLWTHQESKYLCFIWEHGSVRHFDLLLPVLCLNLHTQLWQNACEYPHGALIMLKKGEEPSALWKFGALEVVAVSMAINQCKLFYIFIVWQFNVGVNAPPSCNLAKN